MPYLRITSPILPSAEMAQVAARLTQATNDLFFDPRGRITREELRERTTVHFVPYAPDELYIGARTPAARRAVDITVELSDWGMSRRQRRRIARQLTPVLAEVFGVPREGWDGINIRFHSYHPSEFAVGGRLLSDLVPAIGQIMRRFAG